MAISVMNVSGQEAKILKNPYLYGCYLEIQNDWHKRHMLNSREELLDSLTLHIKFIEC